MCNDSVKADSTSHTGQEILHQKNERKEANPLQEMELQARDEELGLRKSNATTSTGPSTSHPTLPDEGGHLEKMENAGYVEARREEKLMAANSDETEVAHDELTREIEYSYNVIQTDPRYNRYLKIVSPKLLSMQKVKNSLNAGKLPVIGIFYKAKEAGRAKKHHHGLKSMEEHTDSRAVMHGGVAGDPELERTVDIMQTNLKGEYRKRTVALAMFGLLHVFPIATLFPGAGTAGEKAGNKAVKKGATKAAQAHALRGLEDTTEAHIHAKYARTKAFLLYLGLPKSEDSIYQRWEPSRLFLKSLYGGLEEEDLFMMKIGLKEEKKLEDAERVKGEYDLRELNVNLLMILWRLYQCWDWNFLDRIDEGKNGGREKYFRNKRAEWAEEDAEFLQEISIDSHPNLRKVHKAESEIVVDMLVRMYYDHPKMAFARCEDSQKTIQNMIWYWKQIVEHMMKKQEIWGYEDIENHQLQAVLLVESPKSKEMKVKFTDKAKNFPQAVKRLGAKTAHELSSQKKREYKFRDSQVDDKKEKMVQIFHGAAFNGKPGGRAALLELMCTAFQHKWDMAEKHKLGKDDEPDFRPVDTYMQEWSDASLWCDLWLRTGLLERKSEDGFRGLWFTSSDRLSSKAGGLKAAHLNNPHHHPVSHPASGAPVTIHPASPYSPAAPVTVVPEPFPAPGHVAVAPEDRPTPGAPVVVTTTPHH